MELLSNSAFLQKKRWPVLRLDLSFPLRTGNQGSSLLPGYLIRYAVKLGKKHPRFTADLYATRSADRRSACLKNWSLIPEKDRKLKTNTSPRLKVSLR